MISSLRLKNFQSHEDSELLFSTGVNIITGESNSGKTAIVRALTLIAENRPSGSGFIRDLQEKAEIRLRKPESVVTRIRGRSSENSYSLQLGQDKPIVFTAFGSSVPEEIGTCLNLSDINLQQQHSPYFLVFDSPGQVAGYIREIAELEEIDNLISSCQSEIRSAVKDLTYLETDKKEIEKKLSILSTIPLGRFTDALEEMNSLLVDIARKADTITALKALVCQYKETAAKEIFLPSDINDLLADAETAFEAFTIQDSAYTQLTGLVKSLAELKEVNLPEDIKDRFSFVETLIEQYNNIEQETVVLFDLIESLVKYETEVEDISKRICLLLKEEGEVLGMLSNCPSCGQELTEEGKTCLVKGY